jgi:hypothetical protein
MSENQRSGLLPLRNQSLVLLSMRPHRAWVGTAWVMLGTRDLGGADVGGSVQEFPLRPCVRAGINFPQRLNKIIINKVKSPTTNIKYDGTSNRKNACTDPLLVPSDMRRSPTCERCHSEGRWCVLSPIWLPCWILCVVRVRGYLIGRCSRDPEPIEISDPFCREDERRTGSSRYRSPRLRGLLPRHDQSTLRVW